jgi:hypothetical protein
MTLNSLEVTKCCKKTIYFIFFYLQNLIIFMFSLLELFLDEPAMVPRYMNNLHEIPHGMK